METLDLSQHQQIAGPQGLPGREQSPKAQCASVFESDIVSAHRHRHLRLLGGNTEFGEQAAEGRIGPIVVHQERRVDTDDTACAVIHVMGVGVTAQPNVFLVQRDPVPAC